MEDPDEDDVKGGGGGGAAEGGKDETLGLEDLKDFTRPSDAYGGPPPLPGDLECQHELWVMGGAPLAVQQVRAREGASGGLGKFVLTRVRVLLVAAQTKYLKRDERGLVLLVYRWRPDGRSRYRTYVLLGTGFQRPKGEDVPATGRMILYKVGAAGRQAVRGEGVESNGA